MNRLRQSLFALLSLIALSLGACTGTLGGTPGPEVTATPQEVQLTPTPSPTPAPPTVLRLWVPPTFDPNRANDPAAALLLQRLEAFAGAEGITLDIRIKAVDGPGGMLPTLADAEVVAPEAVPEALLLPRWALETAALKGLISPLSVLPQAPDTSAAYSFAQGLAQVQGVTYGLPVGGVALALLYPPDAFAEGLPPTWNALVTSAGLPWRWAAGDPQARLVMGVYHALGGALRSAEGRPTLDQAVLSQTLSGFAQLAQQGLLVPALLDLTTDEAAWEYYGQTPKVLLFVPQTYALQNEGTAWGIAPIPGAEEGAGWAWTDGYLWAVPQQSAPRQALAARWLAQVADPTFLGPWSEALGLLPPNAAALAQWQSTAHCVALEPLAQQATPLPSRDILTTLGPVLQQALAQVIQGASPEEAAQQAVQALPGP